MSNPENLPVSKAAKAAAALLAKFHRHEAVAASPGGLAGGVNLLIYSKGEWTLGRTRIALDPDSAWIIAPASLSHGYVAWRNGKIWREVMVGWDEELPAITSLPEPPEPEPDSDDQPGYGDQVSFTCVCVDGRHQGEQALFKTSSVGGTQMVGALSDDIKARLQEALVLDTEFFYPVVLFGSSSYQHKTRGKILTPQYEIIGYGAPDSTEVEWFDEGDEGGTAPAPAPEPEPAPVVAKAKPRAKPALVVAPAPEPEPEPEPAVVTPAGRSRRGAR